MIGEEEMLMYSITQIPSVVDNHVRLAVSACYTESPLDAEKFVCNMYESLDVAEGVVGKHGISEAAMVEYSNMIMHAVMVRGNAKPVDLSEEEKNIHALAMLRIHSSAMKFGYCVYAILLSMCMPHSLMNIKTKH